MSGGYVVTVYGPGVYGACGVEGCADCLPRYTAANEPVEPSHQEVDTPDALRVATFNAVAELLPPVTSMGMKCVNPAMEEFGPKAIELAMQGSGTLEVNGSTITVEPAKDGGGSC